MKSYAAKVKEKLAKATGTPENSTYKSHGGALSLYIDGKLSTPGQCVAAMQSVADEIAKRWNVSKLGQEGVAVGEATLNEVEQIEKNVDRGTSYAENNNQKLVLLSLNMLQQQVVFLLKLSVKPANKFLQVCLLLVVLKYLLKKQLAPVLL